jgi:hypothetical protein
METKLRCKIGNIEVEYEGSISFLKDDIPNVIQKMLESLKKHTDIEAVNRETPGTPKLSDQSTNTIASHLPTKTGADLVIAACAHLTFSKGQDVCSRKDILTEMQEATTYYKGSYSKKISKNKDRLIKAKH